jgi:hypothetical protein
MDENEIKDGLRGLALMEPTLGFDPDDVATRAAKRQKNRRTTLTAAGARSQWQPRRSSCSPAEEAPRFR